MGLPTGVLSFVHARTACPLIDADATERQAILEYVPAKIKHDFHLKVVGSAAAPQYGKFRRLNEMPFLLANVDIGGSIPLLRASPGMPDIGRENLLPALT